MNKLIERSTSHYDILMADVFKRHPQYTGGESGIWLVKGADTGDMTVSHIPVLGYFSGRFSDVAVRAVHFEQWTGWSTEVGGTIEKLNVEELVD